MNNIVLRPLPEFNLPFVSESKTSIANISRIQFCFTSFLFSARQLIVLRNSENIKNIRFDDKCSVQTK